jgi:ubiquinone/menaquinone biosynthesis C-methylase UbiE
MITLGAFNVERELELMLEWINPQPNQTTLDAACSAGLYARTILQHVKNQATVHALDFSLPFLRKARRYAQRDRVSPFLIQADVNKLPYQDMVFDTIVCGGSLNEFINIPQAVAEFSRVLKPGGLMWQMYLRRAEEPIGTTLQGLLRLSGIRFIDPKTFEKHCNHNSLQLLKAQYRGRIVMALFEKSKS